MLVGAFLSCIAYTKRESRKRAQRAHAQGHRQSTARTSPLTIPSFFTFTTLTYSYKNKNHIGYKGSFLVARTLWGLLVCPGDKK